MSKRKYTIYQAINDSGTNEQTENYQEAFGIYQRSDAPATMYGIDEQGEMSVILSK